LWQSQFFVAPCEKGVIEQDDMARPHIGGEQIEWTLGPRAGCQPNKTYDVRSTDWKYYYFSKNFIKKKTWILCQAVKNDLNYYLFFSQQ